MLPIQEDKAGMSSGVVLSVNRRLARFLTQEYDAIQIHARQRSWASARIMPWSAWLEQCWEALHDQWSVEEGDQAGPLPLLLTPGQERLLWERIIADSPEGAGLIRIADAAQKAREAWNLLQAFEVDLDPDEAALHEDAAAWQRWASRFEAELRRHHWCAVAGLPAFLMARLNQLPLPEQILLAGFDRVTPQQNHFWQLLSAAGVAVKIFQVAPKAGQGVRLAFPDLETEIRAAASWSRGRLEGRLTAMGSQDGHSSAYPIGVVIPGLAACRAQVVRIFQEVFQIRTPMVESLPYNISLGVPLTETAVVRDALLLLELGRGRLEHSIYSRLLATPFMHGGEREWSHRALLDARLRQDGCLSLSVDALIYQAKRGEEGPLCPTLALTLGRFQAERRLLAKADLYADTRQWAVRFAAWLQLLGWPGERALNSGEYQAVASWQESLAGFAALDRVADKMGLSAALALLSRHMQETMFQPESGEAPVQVLGALEAAGERFEAVWVLGLSADIWPPVPEPNPFLPVNFQRLHGMPKCSGEQELLFAKQILNGLWCSADEVIVTYSRQEGDREMRLTPLALHLPESSWESLAVGRWPDYGRMIQATAALEIIEDWRAPPYADGALVTGGAGVIKSQAVCPFQAFARYRLRAKGLETPLPGLNGGQRGELVHLVLKKWWASLGSLSALMTLSPAQWREQATLAIEGAVAEVMARWPEALTSAGQILEQNRLLSLLWLWSELEKTRTVAFEVVEQEEGTLLDVGGVRLNLRMDRVDQLMDGGLVILDYKTGKMAPRIKDWFTSRPLEPQLPLYCLALGRGVEALAFARISPHDMQFIGVGVDAEILPRVPAYVDLRDAEFSDWTEVLNHWQALFADLGRAFRAGDALPDPLPGQCVRCDLLPLCRVDETEMSVDSAVMK